MDQADAEHTFMQSFSDYGDAIFRFSMVKVSDVDLAEDMTQEVFTRYWQYVRAGKDVEHTRALLYTIANNLATDWYRKKKAVSLDERMEAGSEPRDESVGPLEAAEYVGVLRAIEGLEEKDKEVILLRHVEGLDPKDIAEITGETVNVISVRLHRATKRLQKKLGA